MSELKFYKMKDKSDKFTKKKHLTFDTPFRIVAVGSTGSGKTSCLGSLLLLKQFYFNDFSGNNIYIFSNSLKGDFKVQQIVKGKKIPPMNLYDNLDDDILNALYDKLIEEFKEANDAKKIPPSVLIVIDDCSFDGSLRNGFYNAVTRLFHNGRKFNFSVYITSQYLSHIAPSVLSNISGGIFFNMSDRQLDLLSDHYNFLEGGKKQFKRLFRQNVLEKHDSFIINFSNSREEGLYLNKNFEKIG